MKFFIDTANIDEIRSALEMGLVDGVTTNPTLAAKEGREFEPLIKEICKLVGDRPVSAEVISLDAEGMIREAEEVAQWAPNIVVKIPMTTEGIKAVNHLTAKGIKTNVTLVFSPLQALLAAKAGATYISPFVGRLDDIGQNGMELIDQVVTILDNYGLASEVIVASVRHPIHVLDSAMIGAHIATIPYKVIKQLAAHPLTDKGIAAFLSDWEKLQEELKK